MCLSPSLSPNLTHTHTHTCTRACLSTVLQICRVGRTLYPIWFKIANNLSSEFHLTHLTQGHLAKSCPFLVIGVHGLIRQTIHSTGHGNVRELFSSLLDISTKKSHRHFQINLPKFKVILFPAAKLFLF